jgi:hypothetical protein
MNLSEYRAKYPELKDYSDAEIADHVYETKVKAEGYSRDEFDSYFIAPSERSWGDVAKDTGLSIAKGIYGANEAILGAVNEATGGRLNKTLGGGELANAAARRDVTDWLSSNQSQQMQSANQSYDTDKTAIRDEWMAKGRNETMSEIAGAIGGMWNNPMASQDIIASGVGSLPHSIALTAATKNPFAAAGIMGAGASANKVADEILKDQDKVKAYSDTFAGYMQQFNGDEFKALEATARDAQLPAAVIGGVLSMAATKLTGGGKLDQSLASGKGMTAADALKSPLREMGEEALQSPSESIGANIGLKVYAEPDRSVFKGVGYDMVEGAVGGFGAGAAGGAVSFGLNRFSGNQAKPDTRPDIGGNEGVDLVGGESAVVDNHLKRTQDELKAFEKQEEAQIDQALAQTTQQAEANNQAMQQQVVQEQAMPQDPELRAMAESGVPVIEIAPEPQAEAPALGLPGAKPVLPEEDADNELPVTSMVGTAGIQELPLENLTLSNDVPQFKDGANADGVVEPLGGKFDRTGVAPIQVWERKDGRMEIISGRHRADLARRSGEKTIPAQIHREADGFDANKASVLDAELNIRDGQGKVKDYVQYFTATGIDKQKANDRGLLARTLGKRAYTIATNGGDGLITAHRNDSLSDSAAEAIAINFPRDEQRQLVAIQQMAQGKTAETAINITKALGVLGGGDTNLDMFGFDDSAIKEAERMAKQATAIQRGISDDIRSVQGAAKNPTAAAKFGVNVKDPEGVKKRIDELKQQRAMWDNWQTNPDLVAQLRGDFNAVTSQPAETQPIAAVNAPQDDLLTTYDESTIKQQDQAVKAAETQQAQADKKAAIDADVDAFALDMGNVPDDDGGATVDMFAAAPSIEQPAPSIEQKSEKNKPSFDELVNSALTYKGAIRSASGMYGKDVPYELITKGSISDTDNYLIDTYGIDRATARSVTNHIQDKNLNPVDDDVASFENFDFWKEALRVNAKDDAVLSDAPNKAEPQVSKATGKPFASEKSAKLSNTYKSMANPQIVPVDGGYAVVEGEAKKPVEPAKTTKQPVYVGKNSQGGKIYENDDGSRYYVTNGIKIEETRTIDMSRDGMSTSYNSSKRTTDDFLPVAVKEEEKTVLRPRENWRNNLMAAREVVNQIRADGLDTKAMRDNWNSAEGLVNVVDEIVGKPDSRFTLGEESDANIDQKVEVERLQSQKGIPVNFEDGKLVEQKPETSVSGGVTKAGQTFTLKSGKQAKVERHQPKSASPTGEGSVAWRFVGPTKSALNTSTIDEFNALIDIEAKPAKPDTQKSTEQAEMDALKAEMGEALSELVSKLGGKLNMTPEKESEILPVMGKVFTIAAKMGYVKFKDAAKFVLEQLRGISSDTADMLELKHLQAGYINAGGDIMDAASAKSLDDVIDAKGSSEGKEEKTLVDAIYENLESINSNLALKTIIKNVTGTPVKDITPAMLKDAQETFELAMVRKAREVVAEGNDVKTTFDTLLKLYENQPLLNVRSSTSIENQAYSTPAPIAYLSSLVAGINSKTTVYEPTAGNGMLLIGASVNKAVVNELNDKRVAQLRDQGFRVNQGDATTFKPSNNVDSVIMNPPFAPLDAPVKIDGFTIKKIDHLITAKALEAMKPNGRATIIIGADKEAGRIGTADRVFFNWLYSNYNVVDHFEIDGSLYERQGAGWPIRVISLHGRSASNKLSPKDGVIERVNNWSEVYGRFNEALDAVNQSVSERVFSDSDAIRSEQEFTADDLINSQMDANGEAGTSGNQNERAVRDAGGKRRSVGAGRNSDISGNNTTNDRGSNDRVGNSWVAAIENTADTATLEQQGNTGSNQSTGNNDIRGTGKRDNQRSVPVKTAVKKTEKASSYQTEYTTHSNGSNDAVLTPINMAAATDKALTRIEQEVGDLDTYVMNKLGYNSIDEVHEAFMGLQVDTVAAAIYNAERGKAIIIADQTGVGKGRQAAGILRYALRAGKTPIFVTVKPNLFTDMYNDLRDIGELDAAPFIMNKDEYVQDGENRLFRNKPSTHKGVLQSIVNTGKLPEGSNMLFLTYSQLNKENIQREAVTALADNAFFVFDESHNAAGQRESIDKKGKRITTAGFIYNSIANAPVVYLSATYAKRPDNMPVYYRTSLADSVDNVDDLVDAITEGGQQLQTVVSSMLSEEGQLFRRERSFDGIEIKTMIDTSNTAEQVSFADTVTQGLRAITDADRLFHNVFVKKMNEAAKERGMAATGAGNKASSTIDHTNFNSIVHNFISQLLLGMKAKRAAELAVEAFKRGEKPVIALENTMGSFLKGYVEQYGLTVGDVFNADYRDVLSNALERTRSITIKNEKGDKTTKVISLAQLDPVTRQAYDRAAEIIEGLDIGMLPVSPIDYVRNELQKAGMRVAEITGREYMLDYSGDVIKLTKRDKKEIDNRRLTVDMFNDGRLDALVLNNAGSTGLSIHASSKFKDQKQRTMIVMQAMADINILMQMLGRINRTGQIKLPTYTMMGLNIPAEKRPLAKTANKMKSLNANTSANTDSDTSIDAPDILNKYGDLVAAAYLAENEEVADALDLQVSKNQDGDVDANTDLSLKMTGRMALLPVKKQQEIYAEIEAAYSDLIDYLNKVGQNDLVSTVVDLDAKILESKILYEGKAPGTVFGGDATIHKIDAKYQGKPPTSKDVIETLDKAGNAKDIEDAVIAEANANTAFAKSLTARIKEAISEREIAAAKAAVADDDSPAKKLFTEAQQKEDKAIKAEQVYKNSKETFERLISTFRIGTIHRLGLGDDNVTGVVVGIKYNGKGAGNPFSLSKARVSFMVNNGIRSIDLPLSRLSLDTVHLRSLGPSSTYVIQQNFSATEADSNKREYRYVITGNLIAASSKQLGGRIVSFADDKGNINQGILLPSSFNKKGEFEAAGETAPFRMRDTKAMLKFLRNNRDEIGKVGGVTSPKAITKLRPYGSSEWQIVVPKSRTEPESKAVQLNPDLRAIFGDFFTSGTNSMAKFSDSQLPAVLEVLDGLTGLQALASMRPAWESAGGAKAATAVKSFDDAIKLSRAGSRSNVKSTATALTQTLAKSKDAQRLMSSGKVEVVQSESDLPANIQGAIINSTASGSQGLFITSTNKTYLIADNLSTADAMGVLTHEVGVHAWFNTANSEKKAALEKRAVSLLKTRELASGGLREFLDSVQQRMVDAEQVNDNGTYKDNEEAAAYIVEQAINQFADNRYLLNDNKLLDTIGKASKSLANFIADVITYLKSSMHKLGWMDTQKLTAGDLVAIAKGNMREVANGNQPTPPTGGGKPKSSKKVINDSLDEIEQAVNAERERITSKLASGADVAAGLLAIPTLKQIADIAQHTMPQIQSYTDLTDKMAGYRNKLMTESGDIANDVRKWVSKNRPAANRLFDLMHEATISGIDPSEPYKAMDLSLLRQKQAHLDIMQGLSDDHAAEIDELERQIQYELSGERRQEYDALAKKWAVIPNGGRRVYQLMRDHYKLRALQTQKELLNRIARSPMDDDMKAESMAALRLQFESTTKNGVYFPLARFGEYWLVGKNTDGQKEFRMYDSSKELDAARAKMEEMGYEDIASGVKLDAIAMEAGANSAFVADAISKLDDALGEDAKQLKDDIYQFYLRSLPDMSMRKAFIHRKKTKGYSQDALRAFAQKTFHMAHQLSKLRYSDQLSGLMETMRKSAANGGVAKGRLYNEMVKRHQWVLNPNDASWAANLTGLGFLWYLGASPAAALVNTTQLIVTTLPVLSAENGSAAFAEFGKALKDALSTKRMSADEQAMMTLFQEEGVIDTTMAHDLAGMADTETGKYNETRAKIMGYVSWMFHQAEVYNRRVTALAAYRLAKANNNQDAVGYARQKIWETQFDYSNSNRARWMQNNAAKVALLFKQYSQNMSYFIVKNTKEALTGKDLMNKGLSKQERKIATRKIAGLTLATLALGGIAATPFYFVLAGLAGAAGDDDESDALMNQLVDWFGEDWARFIMRGGVNQATGIDISGRMATDLVGLWYRDTGTAKTMDDVFVEFTMQMLGPVVGIGRSAFLGADKMDKYGEMDRGIENMVPKAVKDIMQAGRFATEGALTLGGDKEYAGTALVEEFNAWEIFMKANGFTPESLSHRYDMNKRFMNKDRAIQDRRAGILSEYYMAHRAGDEAALDQILSKDLPAFNEKYPQWAISADTIKRSLETKAKRMEGMRDGVYVSPKMRAYENAQ